MKKPNRHAPAHAPRQVRIIGGQWKRTPLPVIDAPDLRPTPDRVRETVFNWLRHLLDGNWEGVTCLDLFAGSGALGMEAASRGAKAVTLVDSVGPVVRQLEAVKEKLQAQQVSIVRGDGFTTLQQMAGRDQRFDLIFLDPPYSQGWLQKLLPLCEQVLAPGGIIYAEAAEALPQGTESADWMANWQTIRAEQAGLVFYHLLQRANDA